MKIPKHSFAQGNNSSAHRPDPLQSTTKSISLLAKHTQWLLTLVLFFFFGWTFFQQIHQYSDALKSIKDDYLRLWQVYIAVLVSFLLAMILRAHRWAMTLGEPKHLWSCFRSISIGYLIQCPLSKLGEFARVANQRKTGRNPVGILLSTVFLDRLLDVFFMSIVLMTCLYFEKKRLTHNFPEIGAFAPKLSILIALALIAVIIFIAIKEKVIERLENVTFLSPGLKSKITSLLRQINEGFSRCQSPQMIAYLFISNTLVWALYFLCFYLAIGFYPQLSNLSIWDIFVVFTISTIGVLIPVPGGIAYPLFIKSGIIMVAPLVEDATAFSIALVVYCFNFWFINLLCGGASWLWQIARPMSKSQPSEIEPHA